MGDRYAAVRASERASERFAIPTVYREKIQRTSWSIDSEHPVDWLPTSHRAGNPVTQVNSVCRGNSKLRRLRKTVIRLWNAKSGENEEFNEPRNSMATGKTVFIHQRLSSALLLLFSILLCKVVRVRFAEIASLSWLHIRELVPSNELYIPRSI